MAFAFDAGCLVDHVQNSIAFADRFGRAFRDACATGDAVFRIFMVMVVTPVKDYLTAYKIIACQGIASIDNISSLVNFVTVCPNISRISWRATHRGINPKIPKDISITLPEKRDFAYCPEDQCPGNDQAAGNHPKFHHPDIPDRVPKQADKGNGDDNMAKCQPVCAIGEEWISAITVLNALINFLHPLYQGRKNDPPVERPA